MRELVSSLLGVPATILLAGGLGIVAVTLATRVRRGRRERPIRWAHLGIGVGMAGVGLLLLRAGLAVSGAA